MEKNSKSYGFLLSALITALILIVATAILIQVFAAGFTLSERSANKSVALSVAENELLLKRQELERMDLDEVAQLEHAVSSERIDVIVHGDQKQFLVETRWDAQPGEFGTLIEIGVAVALADAQEGGEKLAELETAVYRNGYNGAS